MIGWFPVILFTSGLSLSGQAQDYLQKRDKRGLSKCDHEGCFEGSDPENGCRVLYNQDEVKQVKPQTFKMEQVSFKGRSWITVLGVQNLDLNMLTG